jgi:hypothetical protein
VRLPWALLTKRHWRKELKKNHLALVAVCSAFALFAIGAITSQILLTSRIEARVKSELPNARGVSASFPPLDTPSNLISESFRSANINIKEYPMKGSQTKSSLEINAVNISKAKPTLVGSLDVTATIPTATITKLSGFDGAEIIGKTLQISVGEGGFGKALLVPKYSNNQLYFELQSLSILGNQIPSSSLPADIQTQIKSKSLRNLTAPKGLKVNSVYFSSKGLSLNFRGNNVQLGNLGMAL